MNQTNIETGAEAKPPRKDGRNDKGTEVRKMKDALLATLVLVLYIAVSSLEFYIG